MLLLLVLLGAASSLLHKAKVIDSGQWDQHVYKTHDNLKYVCLNQSINIAKNIYKVINILKLQDLWLSVEEFASGTPTVTPFTSQQIPTFAVWHLW